MAFGELVNVLYIEAPESRALDCRRSYCTDASLDESVRHFQYSAENLWYKCLNEL